MERQRHIIQNGAVQSLPQLNERYTEYAKQLEPKIGIPYNILTPLIFIFVRASVHYALFEDEYYMKSQMEVLRQSVILFMEKYSK